MNNTELHATLLLQEGWVDGYYDDGMYVPDFEYNWMAHKIIEDDDMRITICVYTYPNTDIMVEEFGELPGREHIKHTTYKAGEEVQALAHAIHFISERAVAELKAA